MTEMVETRLIDGEERNAAHPMTFTIPSEEDRHTLAIGDHAKIGLESAEGGERFWVIVTEIRKEDQGAYFYAGTVDNNLVVFDIPYGETIEFDPNNILDVIRNGKPQ